MANSQLTVLILAAGKGTRMKSGKAKVLHEVFNEPMIHHVVRTAQQLEPLQTLVVVGHQQDAVRNALADFPVDYALQEQQLGTGHAVLATEPSLQHRADTIMILCGDTPLIRKETLISMLQAHSAKKSTLTVMTTILENPANYGRILLSADDQVLAIVEEKDATPEQRLIKEINTGIYCVERSFLFPALRNVGTNNSQKEMYLTDIVGIAVSRGIAVEKFTTYNNPKEILGVNSRVELAEATQELQMRQNISLMLGGVTITSPQTVSIARDTVCGQDAKIGPLVSITGKSVVGKESCIGQGAILNNAQIGDNVQIGPYSVIVNTSIPDGSVLPPYSSIGGKIQ